MFHVLDVAFVFHNKCNIKSTLSDRFVNCQQRSEDEGEHKQIFRRIRICCLHLHTMVMAVLCSPLWFAMNLKIKKRKRLEKLSDIFESFFLFAVQNGFQPVRLLTKAICLTSMCLLSSNIFIANKEGQFKTVLLTDRPYLLVKRSQFGSGLHSIGFIWSVTMYTFHCLCVYVLQSHSFGRIAKFYQIGW